MALNNIPPGSTVFIDTNIFLYFFSAHPQFGSPCKIFFEQCRQGLYKPLINEAVLNEVVFGLIMEKGAELLQTTQIRKIREELGKDRALWDFPW